MHFAASQFPEPSHAITNVMVAWLVSVIPKRDAHPYAAKGPPWYHRQSPRRPGTEWSALQFRVQAFTSRPQLGLSSYWFPLLRSTKKDLEGAAEQPQTIQGRWKQLK